MSPLLDKVLDKTNGSQRRTSDDQKANGISKGGSAAPGTYILWEGTHMLCKRDAADARGSNGPTYM